MVEKRARAGIARQLLVSFTFMMAVSSAQAQTDPTTDVKPTATSMTSTPTALQGGVKHDEKLPPLPDQFQVGGQLDDAQLQSMTPDNLWFPIPDWFAGSWHAENKTIDYVEDFSSGKHASPHLVVREAQDSIHGHQRDKTGTIWEYIEIPRVRKVGLDSGSAYLRALKEDVLVTDPKEVVLKYLTNQVTVSGKKQNIVLSKQVQQFTTYAPLEDGVVQVNASLKDFDEKGDPNQLQRSEAVMNRTKPFENTDELHGHDLKKMFADYLQKTGHPELIPN